MGWGSWLGGGRMVIHGWVEDGAVLGWLKMGRCWDARIGGGEGWGMVVMGCGGHGGECRFGKGGTLQPIALIGALRPLHSKSAPSAHRQSQRDGV